MASDSKKKTPQEIVGAVVIGMAVAVFLALLQAVPTYYLWNWLMPKLLALPGVTFWQAWGLAWLAGILFKNTELYSGDKAKALKRLDENVELLAKLAGRR